MTGLGLAGVLALAGCNDDSSVGGDLDVSGGPSTSACRLGECTTTTTTATAVNQAPATSTTARKSNTTTTVVRTTTTQAVTTTTTEEVAIGVKIQSDTTQGGQFDPRQASVPRNSLVRWTNTDSVARSVQADSGEFRSPAIPPGGTFSYRATKAGVINYHDGTRPYAVASLEVY